MYFSNFPYTYYSLYDGANVQIITNVMLRAVVNEDVKNNLSLYDEYDVIDGDTPEIVADKFYNNPQYHWIILHMNDMIDPRYDWPLSTYNLQQYVESKYGSGNSAAIHHYVNANGYQVNANTAGAVSISNFQYEEEVNESKRRIKVLKPSYVSTVVADFTKKIQTT